jgi:NADH-quinone oxidoreductase subunit L
MTWVVRLVVLVPAAAALLGLLVQRRRRTAAVLATASSALVVVLALAQWVAPPRRADISTLGGLPLGDLSVPLHLLSDAMSGLVSFVVALVVLCIQVFTVWYLRDDVRYGRFAATVSLFAAGMLLVVQSADLVLTLVGWEIMGWCSWLLIGHDSERPEARRAAYKAFIVTRVADIGMVVGLVALSVRAGSTDLLDVLTAPASAPGPDLALTVGLVGVIIGVAGKSGLVPFHDWLPDAMEGPTPASALIHAATMVAAGTYVIARLFALYAGHDARALLAVLAAVTMVYAALLALVQTDVKRLLAYSTLSQIAIMLSALAAGPRELRDGVATGAALSHLLGHAFFKALLFLGAGWLAALVGATALAAARGRLRPTGALRWSMGLGFAALAGVPPLIGFFTKDTVIDAALAGAESGVGFAAWLVVVALYATVVLTAAYCTRAWLLLDTPVRASDGAPGHHGHAPITFSAALVVSLLAAFTVVGTLLLTGLKGGIHIGLFSALLSLLLLVGAAFAVWSLSAGGRRDVADAVPQRLRDRAVRGFGADTAYVAFGRAVTALARLVVTLDRDVVDAYPRATAVVVRGLGRAGVRSHRAVPSLSLVALLTGAVVVAVLGVAAWR